MNRSKVGPMSGRQFDQTCRRIVFSMAQGIRADVARAEVRTKQSYAGVSGADVVTTADLNAQERFVTLASQVFPSGVGWIGEENGLRKASTFRDCKVILTIDPADGTRSLVTAIKEGRLPRPGEVSVMLGVLVNGEPVGSYICDVGSLVTYALPPYASRPIRLGANGAKISMRTVKAAESLRSGTLLRHGHRPITNPLTQHLVGSAFGAVQQGNDSIGLSVMRILTGEFVAMLRVAGGYTTPWDDVPIEAILGGQVLALRVNADNFQEVRLDILDQVARRGFDVLYVERRHLRRLERFGRVNLVA